MSYPATLVKVITPIALAISLASCGGDSATFGSDSDSKSPQAELAKSIELSTSSRQLSSDGSIPIIITAIAKNENNNALSEVEVTFSVDKQATIIADEAEGSVKTAKLTPGTAENRTLTVTATSGTVSKSVTVDVVGTKVLIDGPSSITFNEEVPYVLKLTNGAAKPITNEVVTLISTEGNTIVTDSNYETDENGEISFKLIGLKGGNDSLQADVLGVSLTKDIVVSGDNFVLTNSLKEISLKDDEVINLVWTKLGIPQKNILINISATRGKIKSNPADPTVEGQAITSVTTDNNGKASFRVSSTSAGGTVITATATNGLSTALKTEFIAITPTYINTQADPTLIKPNGSSTIITRIRDEDHNPVKNKTIDFRLDDTVNGTLSASTAVTDSLGRASVSYTAGDSSSEKDGVIINTFIQGFEEIKDTITLTVGSNALRIVLGHDHLHAASEVFYIKNYGVIVTDSAGNPVKEQKVDFTIIPLAYMKGRMVWNGLAWRPVYSTPEICPSEDENNNGHLDIGEDTNRNGYLEPTHDAAITGTGVTDDNGRILIEVAYPKSRAEWSWQRITSSVVVAGTEFIEQTNFILPVLAGDVTDADIAPPNMISPYGTSDRCDTFNGEVETVITTAVVDAISGAPTAVLENDTWYKVTFTDNNGNLTDESYIIVPNGNLFGNAKVETGPNNSFRILDRNTEVNSSGFNFVLRFNEVDKPLYYQDDAAVVIPPPEPTDTDAPILTLTGSNTVSLITTDTYIELGANAVDVVDGIIEVSNPTLPTGLTSAPMIVGTYTLIYIATDSSGNTKTENRTITVTP